MRLAWTGWTAWTAWTNWRDVQPLQSLQFLQPLQPLQFLQPVLFIAPSSVSWGKWVESEIFLVPLQVII